jgi:hypothetical protein
MRRAFFAHDMEDNAVPDQAEAAQDISEAVPAHVQDTVEAVARFHSAHEAEAGVLQGAIEQITRRAGRPAFGQDHWAAGRASA